MNNGCQPKMTSGHF